MKTIIGSLRPPPLIFKKAFATPFGIFGSMIWERERLKRLATLEIILEYLINQFY